MRRGERSALARFRRVRPELASSAWRPETMFVLGDRVLLLGSDNSRLGTGIHWLRRELG